MTQAILIWILDALIASAYSIVIWYLWQIKTIEVPKVWMVLVVSELYIGIATTNLYNSTKATHWSERTLSLIIMVCSVLYLTIWLPKVRVPC